MSRFRLNPALVVGAMINGTVEKTVDEKTGTMLRLSQMHPTLAGAFLKGRPGCRMTWCREKARCQCSCKKCVRECTYRTAEARPDPRGLVHIVHSDDGTTIAIMPKEEYEDLMSKLGDIRLVAALRVTPG